MTCEKSFLFIIAAIRLLMSDLNQLSVKYLYSVGECLPYLLNLS